MKTQARAALSFPALALIALAMLSCDNEYGILASIQLEQKQTGSTLFKNTTVTKALKFGAAYYVTTKLLYSRPASGGSWAAVQLGSSLAYTSVGLVSAGAGAAERLYAAAFFSNGSSAVYSSADGSAWTALSLPSIASPKTFTIDALFSAGNEVYAQAHLVDTSSGSAVITYSLYRLDAGTGSFASGLVTGLDGLSSPFKGVASIDGTSFWFATKAALYSGSSSAVSTDQTSAAGLTGSTINGLAASSSYLYVPATSGTLYKYNGAWSSASLGSVPLGAIGIIDVGSYPLLVGTDTASASTSAAGYFECSADAATFVEGSAGTVTLNSSLYSTTVSGKPVLCLFWDSAAQKLFACLAPGASGSVFGLYCSSYSAGVWTGWKAE